MIVNDSDLTVSSGNPTMLVSVSGNDLDDLYFCEKLDSTNFLLSALLFFTLFVWVESKIKNAVRKVMKNE